MPQGCGASVTTVGEACRSSSRRVQHDSLHAQGTSAAHAASHQTCAHGQQHQHQHQHQQQAHACAQQQRQHRRQHCHRRPGSCRPAPGALPRQLLLAALITLSVLPLPGSQLASATEINSAVSIFGPWDYELREDGGSRCIDMVQRTAGLGLNTRTMFLPTLFWVSKHEDGFFEHTKVFPQLPGHARLSTQAAVDAPPLHVSHQSSWVYSRIRSFGTLLIWFRGLGHISMHMTHISDSAALVDCRWMRRSTLMTRGRWSTSASTSSTTARPSRCLSRTSSYARM